MKSIKFILAAFVAVFVTLGSTNVYAQQDGNRDANGYVVRGPYLTNGGGQNWFVGLGGGFNTTVAKGITNPVADFKPANNWAAEAFVGKWFTPSLGVRVGYKGVMNNFGYDPEKVVSAAYGPGEQIRFGYAHGDVMWNLSNALGGYKETRFWDIIPHAGGGILGINNGWTDNTFGLNVGLYNEFRLGRTVNLYLDLNLIGTENVLKLKNVEDGSPVVTNEVPRYERPLYIPTATVGITFNLGKKKNFDRFSSVGVYKADYEKLYNENGELNKRVGALERDNDKLRDQLTDCQNRPLGTKEVVVEKTRVLVGSTVITFPIGSCVLSEVERQKVALFAKSLDGDTLIQIVGSADSKTGSQNRNFALAKNRANVVKNMLVDVYGIAESRISTDYKVDATENPETSRSAILTLSVD